MLLRKKLCVAAVIATVLFLMLASQTIQKRHSLSLSLATSISRASMPRKDSSTGIVVESTASVADQISELESDVPPNTPKPEAEVKLLEKTQEDKRPCGCSDSCLSDLSESKWFSERYDPKQQPVVLGDNNNFDPDALKWWLALQRSGNDQTLEQVMSEMFRVVSPPTVDVTPLSERCRKCAVVGNSGNLQQSRNGKLIDTHDFVIRMNKAVTRGFETDVGNRTTHHFMYPESAVDIDHGVSLVLLPFKLRDLEWLTSALSTGTVKMYEATTQIYS